MRGEELGLGAALSDFARALRYARPVKHLYAAKIGFHLLGLIPLVLIPWPAKILVDHVLQSVPIEDGRYPFFLQPLVDLLVDASPGEIALAVTLFSAVLLVLFGGWSSEAVDQTTANLAEGTDSATRSENAANLGHSYIGGLVGWLEYRLTLNLSQRLNHHYRSSLFERIQQLPMTRLDTQRIGDAMYRLMYDTPQITEVCARLIITPVVVPIQLGVTVWVMQLVYGSEPLVIWAAVAVVPLYFVVSLPFAGPMRRLGHAARVSGAVTTTTMEESMTNVLAVQGLGGQHHERERFEKDSWRSFTDYRRFILLWVAIVVTGSSAVISVGVYVFYALSDRVFVDALSVGDLFVILAFYGGLTELARNVGRLWIYLQDNAAGLRRVFELMDEPSDPQPPTARPIAGAIERIAFEDVSFRYPDGTEALRGTSFEARRGQVIALVGPAGAGKTTIAYMIPRFLSPSAGRVTIDGVDVEELDRRDLRAHIAFVFQEPVLFNASIAENIALGRRGASDEAVREAAELAGALEFIERLPAGFATPIGRGGGRLSVGQKQRLSIARALVRHAPVLILDEPTAALDPETELRLLASLRRIGRDRLVCVVAHRLSTIRHADQILFVEAGRVVERGTHDDLMALQGGAYRRFVELQRSEAA